MRAERLVALPAPNPQTSPGTKTHCCSGCKNHHPAIKSCFPPAGHWRLPNPTHSMCQCRIHNCKMLKSLSQEGNSDSETMHLACAMVRPIDWQADNTMAPPP